MENINIVFTNITEQFWDFVDSNYDRNYDKIKQTISFQKLYNIIQPRDDGIFNYLYIIDHNIDNIIQEQLLPKEVFKTKLHKDGCNVLVFENIDDAFNIMKDLMLIVGNKSNYQKLQLIIKQINMFEDMEEIKERIANIQCK